MEANGVGNFIWHAIMELRFSQLIDKNILYTVDYFQCSLSESELKLTTLHRAFSTIVIFDGDTLLDGQKYYYKDYKAWPLWVQGGITGLAHKDRAMTTTPSSTIMMSLNESPLRKEKANICANSKYKNIYIVCWSCVQILVFSVLKLLHKTLQSIW